MISDLFQPTDLLVLAMIAAIFFGRKKFPELGESLGERLRGFWEGIKGTPQNGPEPREAA